MGADVFWVDTPLDGQLVDELRYRLIEKYLAAAPGRDPYRAAEGFGDYFHANVHSWAMIVAEMERQGLLDGEGIASGKMFGGGPVTPPELERALSSAELEPRTTEDELVGIGNAVKTERGIRSRLPSSVEMISHVDAKARSFPVLWVKWLCYMERAAALGGGFRVDV